MPRVLFLFLGAARRGRGRASDPCGGALGRRAATRGPGAPAHARSAPTALLLTTRRGRSAGAGGVVGVAHRDRDRDPCVAHSLLAELGVTLADGALWLAVAALAGIACRWRRSWLPAWWDARHAHASRRRARPLADERTPLWSARLPRLRASRAVGARLLANRGTGYQLVLAPEGVAAVSVDYSAFLAPLLFWLGMGLLAIRLTRLSLRRGRDRADDSADAALGGPGAARRQRAGAAAATRGCRRRAQRARDRLRHLDLDLQRHLSGAGAGRCRIDQRRRRDRHRHVGSAGGTGRSIA